MITPSHFKKLVKKRENLRNGNADRLSAWAEAEELGKGIRKSYQIETFTFNHSQHDFQI